MSKIILKGYILIPVDELEIVTRALAKHIQLTQQEKGCLIFEVTQDTEVSNRFNVYEEFTDQAAFEIHQQRVQQSDWGNVSTNVERHYQVTKTT